MHKGNYDGEYRCDEHTVKRMIADQVLESRDNEILTGLAKKDLDRRTLSEQKIALAIAYTEGEVTHGRIRGMSSIHRHDLTIYLKELVDKGLLTPYRETRGRFYRLYQPDVSEVSGKLSDFARKQVAREMGINSDNLVSSSQHNGENSQHKNNRKIQSH